MVDWEMADVIQKALLARGRTRELQLFRDGMLDRGITKQFFNTANTEANLDAYQDEEVADFGWNQNFKVAYEILDFLIGIPHGSLRPNLLNQGTDLREIFSNMQASAGVIAPGKRKDEAQAEILQVALKIKEDIKSRGVDFENLWLPAVAFHRAQIGHFIVGGKVTSKWIKLKDRVVWGEDGASVAVQGQYARVFIDKLARTCHQYAGGKSSETISYMINSFCRGKYWVSTDFSKFDQTVPSWLIRRVFKLIKHRFPDECKRELDWIEYDFIHKKIIDYSGRLRRKDKGIPSGNYFTQVVGSFANLLMMFTYLASRCEGSSVKKKDYVLEELRPLCRDNHQLATVFAMGDDNLIFTRTRFSIKEYSTYVKKNFGMTIQPEKSASGATSDPEFLKRSWTRNGEWREPIEFFIQLIHPERDRAYDEDGCSPYHILYGLFLTYKAMMSKFWTEEELIKGMLKSRSKLKPLLTLGQGNQKYVPGALRVMTELQRRDLYDRATRLATRLAA
jgi:hypothetical protein